MLSPTNVGRLRSLHDEKPLFEELRECLQKITAFENRFIALAKVRNGVNLVTIDTY